MLTITNTERVNYVSKKSGKPVKGVRIYFTYPDKRAGIKCGDVFVSERSEYYADAACFVIGDTIVAYNDIVTNQLAYIAKAE